MSTCKVADSIKKGAEIMGAMDKEKGSKGQGLRGSGDREHVVAGADCVDIVSVAQCAHVVAVQWLADVRFVADVVGGSVDLVAGAGSVGIVIGGEGGGGGRFGGWVLGLRCVTASVDFHERSGFRSPGSLGLGFEKKRGTARMARREGGNW